MTIKVDPKAGHLLPQGVVADAGVGPEGRPLTAPNAMEKPSGVVPTPRGSSMRPKPSRRSGPVPSPHKDAADLLAQLGRGGSVAKTATPAALALAASYSLRRSKGSRRKALDLVDACLEAADVDPTAAPTAATSTGAAPARSLRQILLAEASLHETSGDGTLRAVRALVGMLDENQQGAAKETPAGDERGLGGSGSDEAEDPLQLTAQRIEALARATLAHGFVQLASHFPRELAELGLQPFEALHQATRLAEEALDLAPDLPDGPTALGRVMLCHDDREAAQDALDVLRDALSLDPEHDPAEAGIAAALWALGERDEALAAIDRVLKRGNALAQPLILRALLHQELGRLEEARRDVERAVAVAPESGLFRLDAAAIAAAAGDPEAAAAHTERAQALLGPSYEALQAARRP